MKSICMKCGAEYADPKAVCDALVKVERVLEGELCWSNLPCGSTSWCYPAEPAPEPVAPPVEDKRDFKRR